jgi:AraC family transcriptional regulator
MGPRLANNKPLWRRLCLRRSEASNSSIRSRGGRGLNLYAGRSSARRRTTVGTIEPVIYGFIARRMREINDGFVEGHICSMANLYSQLYFSAAGMNSPTPASLRHHKPLRRKCMADSVPLTGDLAEVRNNFLFTGADCFEFTSDFAATGYPVFRVDGGFFQFDLYEGWHEADITLPATNNHLIRILLDSSIRCEFSCGTSRRVGRMTTGDIALVPAACEGRWRWSGLNQTSMDVRICKDWLAQQTWDEPGTARAEIELVPVPCRSDPFILQIALALADEMRAPLAASRKFAAENAGLLLGRHLQRRYARRRPVSADPKCGGLAGWQLRRVKGAMEAAETSLSLEALATMVGLSPAHFCTAFRQSTGLPPRHWQMRLRTERAKTLLADPRLPLTEVALACGYASSSHFATSFRGATGMTPSTYRRR